MWICQIFELSLAREYGSLSYVFSLSVNRCSYHYSWLVLVPLPLYPQSIHELAVLIVFSVAIAACLVGVHNMIRGYKLYYDCLKVISKETYNMEQSKFTKLFGTYFIKGVFYNMELIDLTHCLKLIYTIDSILYFIHNDRQHHLSGSLFINIIIPTHVLVTKLLTIL